jgi:hypothetical protein
MTCQHEPRMKLIHSRLAVRVHRGAPRARCYLGLLDMPRAQHSASRRLRTAPDLPTETREAEPHGHSRNIDVDSRYIHQS